MGREKVLENRFQHPVFPCPQVTSAHRDGAVAVHPIKFFVRNRIADRVPVEPKLFTYRIDTARFKNELLLECIRHGFKPF